MEDTVVVQSPRYVAPRPAEGSSVSGLIGALQREWDALMLDSHEVKRALHTTRQQLSQMMYQYDAACRVIARVTRERDEARARLRDMQRQTASAVASASSSTLGEEGTAPGDADADDTEMDHGGAAKALALQAAFEKMTEANEVLSSARKARKVPKTLNSATAVKGWSEASAALSWHSAEKPAVTALALHPSRPSLLLTGGADKTAILFDKEAGAVAATLQGHSKPLSGVGFFPLEPDRVLITAGKDRTVCVWTPKADAPEATTGIPSAFEPSASRTNAAEITSLSLHPRASLALTTDADGSWSFFDYGSSGRPEVLVAKDSSDVQAAGGYSSSAFHVDGMFFAVASEKLQVVSFWDPRQETAAQTITLPKGCGGAGSVAFSETGYQMAVGGADGSVYLYDLRKPSEEPRSMSVGGVAGVAVRALAFDTSGRYLAAGGVSVSVIGVKKWEALNELSHATDKVTGLAFGTLAKSLVTASLDRHVRWYP